MDERKHTPGPWAVADTASRSQIKAGPFTYHPHYEIIASPAELQSNARLIAAAPDLLAVAQMCAELAERWGVQDPLVQAARAALAKAGA